MLIHMIEGEFLRGSRDFLLSKQRSKIVIKENDIVIMNYNEAEAPIFWSPDAKNWFIGKEPGAGKDWKPEEKPNIEWDGWMGHEFEQAWELVMDREAWLCSPWGCKQSDTT